MTDPRIRSRDPPGRPQSRPEHDGRLGWRPATARAGISPFAVARTGDSLREGVRNGTTTRETEIISRVSSTTTPTGGYATRQSNLSSSGGGAVYGCRPAAGGSAATPQPQNPCLRANNLSTGLAFEFNATDGDVGGLVSVGSGGDVKKPFVTNATGVATGLNVPAGGVSDDAGPGDYTVVFTGDLSGCALAATVTGIAAARSR